jgi:hypothetical protein
METYARKEGNLYAGYKLFLNPFCHNDTLCVQWTNKSPKKAEKNSKMKITKIIENYKKC